MIGSVDSVSTGIGYDREFRVLVDKDDLADRLRREIRAASPLRACELWTCVNRFAAAALNTARSIVRDEPWMAKVRDAEVKETLLQMIEWDHRARHGWDHDTWHDGVHLHQWMDRDVQAALERCWARFSLADATSALLASMDLFGRLAARTADELGFPRFGSERLKEEVRRILDEAGSVATMRLAFSTLAYPNGSLAEAVGTAARYGYEGIELRIVDGELLTSAMTREQRDRTRRTIATTGLTLCCVDTSFGIADPDERIEDGLAYVELAADLGAPLIRLFAGAPATEPWTATVARTGERADALAASGRSAGVVIGIETHDAFAPGAVLAEALEQAPYDVGVIWDTLNPIVAGESPDRTFASVRDRLVHVHIKDGGVAPDLARNELLGHGRVPIDVIIGMLGDAGYDGWLSVEWEKRWQPSIPAADVALPQYAAVLREILDR